MTNKSFTLLEIHLADGAIRIDGNRLLGGGTDADDAHATGDAGAGDGDDGSERPSWASAKAVLVALAVAGVVAAAAFAAARLLGGDLEDAAAIDELTE
ncbi:hypothetical protein [Halorubrum cibi]|uniref:Uncharacterized protein n=1 Tax=Halorubrum cibi TaxID=413815 RepID=A0A521CVQ5_9EURY|nr:hypothetical protein [Halorubrum cibi]SMO63515.1 hypothetical protein SAMN06264867_105140 [Halorubrum cibi]